MKSARDVVLKHKPGKRRRVNGAKVRVATESKRDSECVYKRESVCVRKRERERNQRIVDAAPTHLFPRSTLLQTQHFEDLRLSKVFYPSLADQKLSLDMELA